MAKTRILATLGPASSSEAMIQALVEAGANAFRLNFSHGEHEDHRRSVERVRRVSERLGVPIAIMQDLQGPKIRTAALKDGKPVLLESGEEIRVSTLAKESEPGIIATTYKNLVSDVGVGDRILLDDGNLELRCKTKTEDELVCEIVCGGILRANKGINLPGVNVSTPSMTPKDYRDLEFGMTLGVDFVALSFVRHADDVRHLRNTVRKLGYDPAIIAKIEKPEALVHLKEIVAASEGIMVARGDLGVEVPSEQLPVMQKEIISAARERGRIVITATQMLESMIENPRPTRAETSDVANAILDGTDAVMLSGETAVGKHPVGAVAAMTDIALFTEQSAIYERSMGRIEMDSGGDVADATVHAAAVAARELGAKMIVAFSSSGRTCFKISFARPRTRIIGATFTEAAFQRLALCWGIHAVLMKEAESIDDLYFKAEKHLFENNLVEPGELAVLVTGSNILGGGTNTIKIHRAGVVDVTADEGVIAKFQQLYSKLGI